MTPNKPTKLTKEYDDFFGSLHKSPFKNVPKMKRKRLILKFVRLMIEKFNK